MLLCYYITFLGSYLVMRNSKLTICSFGEEYQVICSVQQEIQILSPVIVISYTLVNLVTEFGDVVTRNYEKSSSLILYRLRSRKLAPFGIRYNFGRNWPSWRVWRVMATPSQIGINTGRLQGIIQRMNECQMWVRIALFLSLSLSLSLSFSCIRIKV